MSFGLLSLLFLPMGAAALSPSTTTLAVSPASGGAGTIVTLSATVRAAGVPVHPGLVLFCDASASFCTDIHLLGTAQLTAAGTAALKLVGGVGTRSYKAVFVGTNTYATSSSAAAPVRLTGAYLTTTGISASGAAGAYSLTGSVAAVQPAGAAGPGGTVSFLDASNGNRVVGSGTLGASTSAFSFVTGQILSAGGAPNAIVTADFNGDGIPDLAIANYSGNSVTVLLANGDGTYSAAANPAAGAHAFNNPDSIAVGDFNGDGNVDMAVTNFGTSTVTVLLGNGDGTFTPATASLGAASPALSSPYAVATGDFDGDGNADLVVTNVYDNTITVLLGNGDGTFRAKTSPSYVGPATGESPVSVVVGDFNGDGKADVATTNLNDSTISVLLGKGDGTFTAVGPNQVTGSESYSLAIADLNGDGKTDVVVANYSRSSVSVLLGKGDGTFTVAASPATGTSPNAIGVGDFNGDGIPDLAAANKTDSTVTILLGKGDGTFTLGATPPTGTGSSGAGPVSLAVGNFNGFGLPGVATADYFSGQATVLLAHLVETATATASGISPVGSGTHQVYASYGGDASHSTSLSSNTGLTAQAAVTTLTLSASPASSTFGQHVVLTATLSPFTAQGYSTDGEAVSFKSGGSLLGTGTLSGGVATLNVTSLAAGVDSLTAVFAADGNFAGSTSNPVSYAVAVVSSTALQVTSAGAPATTVAAGSVVTLTATVTAGGAPVTAGVVEFCDASAAYCSDIHVLGTAQLTSAGRAVLRFVPGIGSHRYKAVFLGTGTNAASSSGAATLAVTGSFPSAATISETGSPGSYAVTTTVVGDGSTAVPSGTVSFLDTTNGNYVLGTAVLGSGNVGLAFSNQGAPATGVYPVAIALADFNGDGKMDMAVANNGSNTVTVVLGNGDGSFTPAPTVSGLGTAPSAIAAGDFNGDGKTDLVVTNSGSNTLTVLLGNGDGTFSAAGGGALPTGLSPSSVAVGDFNGDGKADLAVANGSSNNVTIYLGNGDGTFTAAPGRPSTGNVPSSVMVGDFNGDGRADLAVVNSSSGTVTILLGNGDGTFTAAAVSPGTGASPLSAVVGDFNGDGKADLAVANHGGGVTVLLGGGDGTFTATASSPATGSLPYSIALGDFNGDGVADLAVANAGSNSITVLLGKGDGTFTAATVSPTTGILPFAVAVGDFNGDGNGDLAVANYNSYTVTVVLSQPGANATATALGVAPVGTGTHLIEATYPGDAVYSASTSGTVGLTAVAVPTSLTLSVSPSSSTFGQAVLLTATLSPSTAQGHSTDGERVTFYNKGSAIGTGALSGGVATLSLSSLPAGTDNLSVGFAGDATFGSAVSGVLSFVVSAGVTTTGLTVTAGGSGVTTVASGSVVTLSASVTVGTTRVTTGQVQFCDAAASNCSGIHLLGTAQLTTAGVAVLRFVPGIGHHSYKAMFVGTASDVASSSSTVSLTVTGSFATATAIAASGTPTSYTLTVTVTGTGGTAPVTGTVSFLNASAGSAVLGSAALGGATTTLSLLPSGTPATGNGPQSVAVGDFNGDGKPDVAIANYLSNTVTVLLGNGDGTFTASAASPATGLGPYAIAAGDFNGDGKTDLAVANAGGTSSSVTVLLGNGDGTFTATAASPGTGFDPYSIAVGDFNGDGRMDLAVANFLSSSVTILLGNGDGTFVAAAASPATGSGPYSIAVGDFNGDGKLDLAVANSGSNTVTSLLGNGDGTFTSIGAYPTTGTTPYSVVVGDFNGDGKADLAVANNGSGTVSVLLGKGDGTFAATGAYSGGTEPKSLAVGDFDGDGNADLAVVSNGGKTLVVLLGNGAGAFTTGATAVTGRAPYAVAAADFNGDGVMDLLAANSLDNSASVFLTQRVETASAVLLGVSVQGTGTYNAVASYPGDANYASSVSAPVVLTTVPYPPAATPVFSPGTGSYTSAQTVAITDATAGATIFYTTDGTAPTTGSARYSGPLTVSSTETINAIATAPSSVTSAVGTAVITINIPPVITSGPASQTISSGKTATLAVTATGTAPLSYQWYQGASPSTALPVSGATGSSFVTPALTASTSYWVQVSNASGVPANSATAVITVVTAPTISSQSQTPSGALLPGQSATLSVLVAGTSPTYQWYQGTSPNTANPVAGAVGSSYTTPALSATTSYWVQASNSAGVANSTTFVVTVNQPPVITSGPVSQTISSGGTATLSVTATGTAPLSYQWYQGASPSTVLPVIGATGSSFVTPALTATTSYWVQVSNASATPANSATAVITVVTAPRISSQSQTPAGALSPGQSATLSVVVAGTSPTYQWYQGASPSTANPIAGAVGSSYTTAALSSAASYWVQVSNSAGVANSATFAVVVNQLPVCSLSVQGTSAILTVTAAASCSDPQGQPLTTTLNWGDGTSVSAAAVNTHTYAAAGSYTVVLSATDTSGLTGTAQQVVAPNNLPACFLGVDKGVALSGNPVTYSVSATASCTDPHNLALTTVIDWGDGSPVGPAVNNGTNSHTYAAPGTYLIVLTATNALGLSGSSAPQKPFLPAPPVVTAGGSSPVSTTVAAPSPMVSGTLVTFLCSSVSTVVNGTTVNNALPAVYGISCTSPTVALSSSPTPVSVTIQTTAATVAGVRLQPGNGSPTGVLLGFVLPLPVFGFLGWGALLSGRRRRRRSGAGAWGMLLLLICVLAVSSCGGHFTLPPSAPTPAGVYYVTVTEVVVNPPAPTGFVQTSLIVPLPVGK